MAPSYCPDPVFRQGAVGTLQKLWAVTRGVHDSLPLDLGGYNCSAARACAVSKSPGQCYLAATWVYSLQQNNSAGSKKILKALT